MQTYILYLYYNFTFRVRAQRYNNFRNYKNCYIFVTKKNKLLLCTSTTLYYKV